ncbi:WD40-repeat-containing domain protein [Crucibulum laeve]|uniref:WD40-repeat-containing domain protein n=1 Tax=Crucibulum laeve TaxID=68775 RepID=A0A5C3M4A2_9AGAR|nr:WD40-repeat-containing domain protein [Crucibulum laeve]
MSSNSLPLFLNSENYPITDGKFSTKPSERLLKVLKGHTNNVYTVAYSPDGKCIASGSGDSTVTVWKSDTGLKAMRPLIGHNVSVRSVTYSPDGKYILSSSGDSTICIWDANTGQMIGEPFQGHTEYVYSAAYSPDGRHVVSGSQDKTITIWDVGTRKTIVKPLEGHSDDVNSVSYSPNGMHIISGSEDKTIKIWDATTGENILEPLHHPSYVYSAVYSPDGKYIASACGDHNVYLWDSGTGVQVIDPLKGHSGPVTCVSFSPDGKYLASCSDDETIRVWYLKTGKEAIPALEGHTDAIESVVYSPDGQHIISGSDDQTVRIWNAIIPEDDEDWFLDQDASKVQGLNSNKSNEGVESIESLSDNHSGVLKPNFFEYELTALSRDDIVKERPTGYSTVAEQPPMQKQKMVVDKVSEVTGGEDEDIQMNEIPRSSPMQHESEGYSELAVPARSKYVSTTRKIFYTGPIPSPLPQPQPRRYQIPLTSPRGLPIPPMSSAVFGPMKSSTLIRVCIATKCKKILVTLPTCGMYSVYAKVNDVGVVKTSLEFLSNAGVESKKGRFNLRFNEKG